MSFIGEAILGIGATPSAAAPAAAGGFGLGSGFWSIIGAGLTLASTLSTIRANNQMALANLIDTGVQREAVSLDYARRRSDIRRETDREISRRTALLSATGGLTDGVDLVLEGLLEGARAEARLTTDVGFELGALTRRSENIMAGSRRANIGALIEGGARMSDFIARALPRGSSNSRHTA